MCVTNSTAQPISARGARPLWPRPQHAARLFSVFSVCDDTLGQWLPWLSVEKAPLKQTASAFLSFSNHDTTTHDMHWLTVRCRYGIAGLKALARSKFIEQIDLHLGSSEFPEACQEAYESTFHTDRGLRDVIIQAFRANPGLSLRSDVEMMVRETPGLAFELFRMASGLPVSS